MDNTLKTSPDPDIVDFVDLDVLARLISEWDGAKPKAPHKVLFFNRCFGYDHVQGRKYGEWLFLEAGKRTGAWQAFKTDDPTKLADREFLKDFDAILLCNSSKLEEAVAPGLTEALKDYVKSGKSMALIHAGLDAFDDSDELLDMFGGWFKGHPWHGDGNWRFLNEDPASPINKSFRNLAVTFTKADEIYEFPAFFNRNTCHVLVSMDLSDPFTKDAETWWSNRFGKASIRADHDYAVSWTRNYGAGRIFYTSFGHDRKAFLDRDRLYHMFAGLQYVLGDLDIDEKPLHGPAIAEKRVDWAGGPWGFRLSKQAKDAAGKNFDIVFFGDSITMGWINSKDYKYPGGKEAWDSHFGKLETMNLGMSGDRSEHLLWRITDDGQADGWTAKNIFLMIGINNFGQTRKGWKKPDTPEEAASGAKAILDALVAKHPESKIILLGALPWGEHDGFKWVRDYNAILKTFEDGNVIFRDYGEAFMNSPDSQKSELFVDGLHPGPAGYEVFADCMEKTLAE